MEWISVKDQPLPTDKPSLIMIEDGTVHVGYPYLMFYHDKRTQQRWMVGGWERCHMCGGESMISLEGEYGEKKPTHWMPLPELKRDCYGRIAQ